MWSSGVRCCRVTSALLSHTPQPPSWPQVIAHSQGCSRSSGPLSGPHSFPAPVGVQGYPHDRRPQGCFLSCQLGGLGLVPSVLSLCRAAGHLYRGDKDELFMLVHLDRASMLSISGTLKREEIHLKVEVLNFLHASPLERGRRILLDKPSSCAFVFNILGP
ncbi:uncharacterized [Tachysurus ichikawai]